MVVQHNMQAMNASRMLGITNGQQAKSTEKLSSGYKINRAADDAAGLSISEKMRKQIRGLDQASTNAQDGVSAVQTAEGALTEVHSMLQRMNELAVQAANGTNSTSDRDAIQAEIDQLTTEIDRVAETTKFNETYLLRGDENVSKTTDETFRTIDLSLVKKVMAEGSTLTVTTAAITSTGKQTYNFQSGLKIGDTFNGMKVVASASTPSAGEIKLSAATAKELEDINKVFAAYASEMGMASSVTIVSGDNALTATKDTFEYNKAQTLSLHVGADSTQNNKIEIAIDSMSSASLHVKGLKVDGKTSLQATAAIDKIADAVAKVSKQRSALGAIQNRLEHTIDNLDNVVENTTASESRIRDTDIADEMVKYSKNNILAQAGQSMLAQANQSTQGALSLIG